MDNLSDITEEGDLSDLDPNFNSDDSEFGEEFGSSSDNTDRRVDGTSGRLTKIAGNYQSLMICFGIGNYEEQDQAININNVKFKLIQILAFKLLLLQVNTTIKKFGTRYTPGNAVVEVITFVRRINKLIFKFELPDFFPVVRNEKSATTFTFQMTYNLRLIRYQCQASFAD
ncbi:hypothetical protein QE152_g987 [Popillia japonica]|uniref:Uncharacterized protein n=1 Tax=Popillia japonica TaxID=7064 RepID=A0AAW1NBH6_POPJA